jgi:hypothetical protein
MMTTSAFDPREVLEKYVAVLREPASSVVRDASELAHPKEAIRIVLQHCIKTATAVRSCRMVDPTGAASLARHALKKSCTLGSGRLRRRYPHVSRLIHNS